MSTTHSTFPSAEPNPDTLHMALDNINNASRHTKSREYNDYIDSQKKYSSFHQGQNPYAICIPNFYQVHNDKHPNQLSHTSSDEYMLDKSVNDVTDDNTHETVHNIPSSIIIKEMTSFDAVDAFNHTPLLQSIASYQYYNTTNTPLHWNGGFTPYLLTTQQQGQQQQFFGFPSTNTTSLNIINKQTDLPLSLIISNRHITPISQFYLHGKTILRNVIENSTKHGTPIFLFLQFIFVIHFMQEFERNSQHQLDNGSDNNKMREYYAEFVAEFDSFINKQYGEIIKNDDVLFIKTFVGAQPFDAIVNHIESPSPRHRRTYRTQPRMVSTSTPPQQQNQIEQTTIINFPTYTTSNSNNNNSPSFEYDIPENYLRAVQDKLEYTIDQYTENNTPENNTSQFHITLHNNIAHWLRDHCIKRYHVLSKQYNNTNPEKGNITFTNAPELNKITKNDQFRIKFFPLDILYSLWDTKNNTFINIRDILQAESFKKPLFLFDEMGTQVALHFQHLNHVETMLLFYHAFDHSIKYYLDNIVDFF